MFSGIIEQVGKIETVAPEGDSALRLMKLLRESGSHITYGAMGRKPLTIPNGLLIFRDIRVRGLWVTRWTEATPADEVNAVYQNLAARVAAGTPMMSIIPLKQVWVDANFKEVQLRKIRLGQPVRLTADVYGKKVEYKGTVAGLGAGTGAAFALLPAQNATGNWIKVVQRVPVRVMLDAEQLAQARDPEGKQRGDDARDHCGQQRFVRRHRSHGEQGSTHAAVGEDAEGHRVEHHQGR